MYRNLEGLIGGMNLSKCPTGSQDNGIDSLLQILREEKGRLFFVVISLLPLQPDLRSKAVCISVSIAFIAA